jgi:hypothetical protein
LLLQKYYYLKVNDPLEMQYIFRNIYNTTLEVVDHTAKASEKQEMHNIEIREMKEAKQGSMLVVGCNSN